MWDVIAGAVGSIASGLVASNAQKKAAEAAANAQTTASNNAIAEQKRQFDAIQQMLGPYAAGGLTAFDKQMALSGAHGLQKQLGAYDELEQSPVFASMLKQGENAMLQNAAATGGLRGGNTQNALMQFRPQLLNQMATDQFNRLGAISQQGLGAATNTGVAGQAYASNVGNLMQNIGNANAANALARGQAGITLGNSLAQGFGALSKLF